MRVIVIGGTGHIGTYLTPRLVEAGHDVVSVSRRQREPYQPHAAWTDVQHETIDRATEEAAGTFGRRIRDLRPDAVIDLICYHPESARHLVDALRDHVGNFLHCGTIWVHGASIEVPTSEEQTREPFGDYGCRKAEIERYLLTEAAERGFPAAILHPGHLVGPGWNPINPAGNFNPQIFADLATGKEVLIPHLGNETVHHVHVDDVAQAFERALDHWPHAVGQSFHIVSPAALTLRGYAGIVAGWFGRAPTLRFLPWEEWRSSASERDARVTWDHIAHSPNCGIRKAERLLDYRPRYRSADAIHEAVDSLIARGIITL